MKFIVTRELGRLARWLRILGFDTAYFNQGGSGSLIIQALREERIVITRNQRLSRTSGVRTLFIETQTVREQIKEVYARLRIPSGSERMFSRCIICNRELERVAKEAAKGQVPPYVFETQQDFLRCPCCRRIYWQGTHWGNVQQIVKEIGPPWNS